MIATNGLITYWSSIFFFPKTFLVSAKNSKLTTCSLALVLKTKTV